MKKALTILSIISFLGIPFWYGIYYILALTYLYKSLDVIKHILFFVFIVSLAVIFLITIILLMFKSKKILRIICIILLIAFIPIALYASFYKMVVLVVTGPYGCSYTEDISNYGKYDTEFELPHFPTSITEDMTVVTFAYFYKGSDMNQSDIYLEVKFDDAATMDKHLTEAKDSFFDGVIEYLNPYNDKYTDVIGYLNDSKVHNWYMDNNSVKFGEFNDYRYVEFFYTSITYSYEELTIIYNFSRIGSDTEIGAEPDKGQYYPKFLERFGVEWDTSNNFDSENAV